MDRLQRITRAAQIRHGRTTAAPADSFVAAGVTQGVREERQQHQHLRARLLSKSCVVG
jgi:hypothetical protein